MESSLQKEILSEIGEKRKEAYYCLSKSELWSATWSYNRGLVDSLDQIYDLIRNWNEPNHGKIKTKPSREGRT